MRIAILANQSGWHYRDLCRASHSLAGLELVAANFGQLSATLRMGASLVFSGANCLNEVDCVLARAMPGGTLQQIVFRMDALQELACQGIPVVNSPKAIEASVDKYLSLSLIRREGIAIPATIVSQETEPLVSFFEEHGDVVLKPIFGSEGRGLKRFSSRGDLTQFLQSVESGEVELDSGRGSTSDSGLGTQSGTQSGSQSGSQIGSVYYLQEFLPHEFDIRVLVIGDEVLGMKRINPTNWITNACQGATCLPYDLPEREAEMARRAAKAVGGMLVGIDILHDASGEPRVLEVNAAPGWKAISETLQVDVAERVLRLLVAETRDV